MGIQRKLAETEADDEDHNLRTVVHHKLDDMLQHDLRDEEVDSRQKRIFGLYSRWIGKLDSLIQRLSNDENLPAIRRRVRDRKFQRALLEDLDQMTHSQFDIKMPLLKRLSLSAVDESVHL